MPFYFYEWNESNIDYIAQHGVTQDEFEEVVSDPDRSEESHSSDRVVALGTTSTGRYLGCVYEMIDDMTVYPFAAFEIDASIMSTIEWTPEQIAERERQKAANPPDRRTSIELTPEQKAALRKSAEEEQANKEATIAHFRKIEAAAREPGFIGDLRRAINASGHRVIQLPEEIGVDVRLLDDFRSGDADLSADAIARLVDALDLRLMQEIPPAVNKPPLEASA